MPGPGGVPERAVPTNTSYLTGFDDNGNFFKVKLSDLATLFGAVGGGGGSPGPGTVDLRVIAIRMYVSNTEVQQVNEGDHVVFEADVKNFGTDAMPGGTIAADEQLDVSFVIGETVSWADQYESALAAGGIATLRANSGPTAVAYWTAAGTNVSVTAVVNSSGRKVESDTGNNSLSRTITIVPVGGGGGGGGSPTSATVGTPAWKMMGWGSPAWWFESDSDFALAHSQGWGGDTVGIQYMGGVMGGAYGFKGTTAAGDSDASQYFYQRIVEGLTTENANRTAMAYATANGMSSGIGFYTRELGQDVDLPPFGGDWGDTTQRASVASYLAGVAGFLNLCGGDEIHFDIEQNGVGWGIGAPTATRQAAFDFGKVLSQAFYGVKQNADTAVYSWYSTDGFDGTVQNISQGAPTDYAKNSVMDDFFCGWMEGMRLSNATGKVYNLDAKFYRHPGNYVSGASYAGAYRLDIERAMAFLSKIAKPGGSEVRPWASEALWTFIANHYRAACFSWRGTDGTGFYNDTQPDDAAWSLDASNGRAFSMGPKRYEYTYAGSQQSESWYGNSGFISAAQAADDTTAISTAQPTISSLAKVANGGGSFTVTCNASHAYGVTHVDLYLGSTLLQTMGMVWNANGGSIADGYPSAFQACTATITGRTAGDVITAVAYSAKDDRKASMITL